MQQSRGDFIKQMSLTALAVAAGCFKQISGAELSLLQSKIKCRFAVMSDGHYGQSGTKFNEYFHAIVASINSFHKTHPLNCCFINGDIIHDEPFFLPVAKDLLDKLKVPYYTAKGNHDKVSNEYWQHVWGTFPDHIISMQDISFIIANTSNELGEYLSPDFKWLQKQLELQRSQSSVFLILHIPQTKWTANAIETPAFFELVNNYTNIKAVFHGHEHDHDEVKWKDGIPYIFDGHFGGDWGTQYRGFRVVEVMDDNSFVTYMMDPVSQCNMSVVSSLGKKET